MAQTTTTFSCPTCRHVIGTTYNGWSIGDPVVRCAKCGNLIRTGWHKHVTNSEKFWNGWLWILLGIGGMVWIAIYLINNNSEAWLLILLGLTFIIPGWLTLKRYKEYENSDHAKSDEIPTL